MSGQRHDAAGGSTWCRRDPDDHTRCVTHAQDWDRCLVYTPPGTWSDEDAALHMEVPDA